MPLTGWRKQCFNNCDLELLLLGQISIFLFTLHVRTEQPA
jgi:hypothetical protein